MKDFVRLLVLAVLVFIVVGFAMIYSRDNAFRYGLHAFIGNGWGALQRSVVDLTGWQFGDGGPKFAETKLRILRSNQTHWVGLTGFPDQTEVRFPVPVSVGEFHSGELDLRFDVQLAQGGDGLLSIRVNGVRRSEIVLNDGHNAYDVRVPLDQTDLLVKHISVALFARGITNSGQICPTDASNAGSAISLLPQSALVLHTLREVDHPSTALMALPDPLQINFGRTERSQTIAIWVAQHMSRAGVDVRLVDRPVNSVSIDIVEQNPEDVSISPTGNIVLAGPAGIAQAIAFHRADALTPAALTGWPVSVENLGVETIARNFRGSRRWTIPYKIADMPIGRMPTNLDLALKASILAGEYEWVVRVSLNGNLLHTARLPGSDPDIRLSVALPIEMQGLTNSVLIELIDTSPNESICRVGPDAQAQLLPESRLFSSAPQPQSGWGALVRRLAASAYVSNGNSGLLDLQQGRRAATMLAQFLPAEANVGFGANTSGFTITTVNKERLARILAEASKSSYVDMRDSWLVTDTGESAVNPLSLNQLGTGNNRALLAQMYPTDIAFIVQNTQSP